MSKSEPTPQDDIITPLDEQPLTRRHGFTSIWSEGDFKDYEWLQTMLTECVHRVTWPLENLHYEVMVAMAALVRPGLNDDQSRQFNELWDTLTAIGHITMGIALELCAHVMAHGPAELKVLNVNEHAVQTFLEAAGMSIPRHAGDAMLNALGGLIKGFRNALPDLPEDWYTRASTDKREAARRKDGNGGESDG